MMRGLDTVLGMRIWILVWISWASVVIPMKHQSLVKEESVGQDVDPSEDPDSHPADDFEWCHGSDGPHWSGCGHSQLCGNAVPVQTVRDSQQYQCH